MNKTYWKGLDEKVQSPEFQERASKEFQDDLPVEEFVGSEEVSQFKTGRRDFLKFLGFGVAAATLASCETPVIKSVPYVNKPEDITPGVANWYASTFFDGNDFANILVKSREGRPIWIKGNNSFGITKGGLTPRVNASVLNVYNSERLQNPTIEGKESSWTDVDNAVMSDLAGAGSIKLMTSTLASPSTQMAIEAFKNKFGNVEVVEYDAVSYSAMRKANKKNFGEAIIPDYDFSKAKSIVSIDADFISNWIFPTKFSAEYAQTRNPDDKKQDMSRHFQFETVMTLTGANADYRTMIKPSQQGLVAAGLLKAVGGKDLGVSVPEELTASIEKAADHLKKNKGKSIVVAGANDESVQLIVNAINDTLGNYGSTIDTSKPLNVKKGDDAKVEQLVNDVIGGKVKGLILYNVNPVYSLPNGKEFGEALANVPVSISFSQFADETASKCKYACPDHNFLESWNDYNIKYGDYSIQQPLIRPLFNTRQAQESLLVWAGEATRGDKESKVYYDFMRGLWEKHGFSSQSEYATFEDYWNWSVHNGSSVSVNIPPMSLSYSDATSGAAAGVKAMAAKGEGAKFEFIAYTTGEMGEGQYAANPWLQELPNAITKVTWDNYVTMNVQDACEVLDIPFDKENQISAYNALHIGQEDKAYLVNVKVGEATLKLPVYPLPGQARGTIGIALGYGRGEGDEMIGKAAYQVEVGDGSQTGEYILTDGKRTPIGGNAYRFLSLNNGQMDYYAAAEVSNADERYYLACTQTHHTIMGRTSVVKETDLSTFINEPMKAFNHTHELHVYEDGGHVHKDPVELSLWDEHPVEHVGHRWAMSVDLSSCNGCGVCIVACHSENNVPVVGKDEVRRVRDMHWLRMDRYFSSIDDEKREHYDHAMHNGDFENAGEFSYDNLEVPEESPQVVFMPMMCQHCNHAPCETVCPVAATTHSNEGLNMMAYNRCIGTRYCGNNCPYKVRRFNWFNYRDYKKFDKVNPTHDEYARLVLNPDVVVRSRGVMEKCTFCVQRIQEGKLNAKAEGRSVVDGDVVAACADACPSDSIRFGDWNDHESAVRNLTDNKVRMAAGQDENKRVYQALHEIGVKPNVYYQLKVRNVDVEAHGHGEAHGEEEHHA
ncbi:TAT-variant-translocated molybdopterin oxidoreductase [Parvicella tangerina]|uniref:4Fe-4S ferredoxin-type domain-containing protein n=1 Tax=Parvicella tangerina TaxID=2829795 RepID=A0A916JQ25_9FLAO|nr:TAT-variant-translocated molybdopterin oxidoreductase [Parvicella tangerina]CAG5086361.1 hypothetical protein CRYO30217_03095 [Parvicella tangerina]